MPELGGYARRVEEEMPPALRRVADEAPRKKRCPVCHADNDLGETTCVVCQHQFPVPGPVRHKTCPDCQAINPRSATSCHACGSSFEANFTLSLDEALRTGAIVRGMDLDENEVCEGEKIAVPVREKILQSGDAQLVHILRVLPEESYARLKDILGSLS